MSSTGFTLGVKAGKENHFFNLPLYGADLTPKEKKDTYQLGRPIYNLWDQCYWNKILLFWWNLHCKIKINPKSNSLCLPFFSFHFSSLFSLLLSFCACLWMMKGAFIFFYLRYGHKKHKNYKNLVCRLIHSGLTLKA